MRQITIYALLIVLSALAVFLVLLPRLFQKSQVQVVQRIVVSPAETVYIADPAITRQVEYWRARALAPPNVKSTPAKIIRDTLTLTLVKATPTTVRMDFTRDYLTVWTVQDSTIQQWRARLNSPTGTVLISPIGVSVVRTRPVLVIFGSLDVAGNFGKPLDLSTVIMAGVKLRWARWQVRAGLAGYLPELRAGWRAGVEVEI